MEYISFDYHKQHSFATAINKQTGETRTAKLSNKPEALKSFTRDPDTTHAVLESSRTRSVFYELLKGHVAVVKLVDCITNKSH